MTELTPKKIFIDCDETICHSPPDAQGQRAYDQAQPWWDNIAKANRLYDQGHYIVYWTARGTQTGIDWKEVTQQQLHRWGVKHHELRLGKPAFDLLIDDKVLNSLHHWEDNIINQMLYSSN